MIWAAPPSFPPCQSELKEQPNFFHFHTYLSFPGSTGESSFKIWIVSLSTIHHQQSTIHYSLFTFHQAHSAVGHYPPATINHLPFYNETQASETKYTEACWTNYPRSEVVSQADDRKRKANYPANTRLVVVGRDGAGLKYFCVQKYSCNVFKKLYYSTQLVNL